MMSFVKRYQVPIYFVMAYAITWTGILLVLGPEGLRGGALTTPQFLLVWAAMILGPGMTGILLTAIVDGRRGLRDFLSRLGRWRIGLRWYAMLLIVPLLTIAILSALSLVSPAFLPDAVLSGDKAFLLVTFVMLAFGACVEELGWTGFAVHKLRLRYSVLSTGLMVGSLWATWHFLGDFVGSRAFYGELFPLHFFTFWLVSLTAFRVLMAWVYERTESLLLAMLMHVFYTAPLFMLRPSAASAAENVLYEVLFTVALCTIVAVVVTARRPIYRPTASDVPVGQRT